MFAVLVLVVAALAAACSSAASSSTPTPTNFIARRSVTPTPAPTPPPIPTPTPIHRFDFAIPADIETLSDAIDYVRSVEDAKWGEGQHALVRSNDTDMTTAMASISEIAPPIFLVELYAPTLADAQALKVTWGDEFRRLFDRWDVCDIDIAWSLNRRNPDGSSTDYATGNNNDPNNDLWISPGCSGPAVQERNPYGR